MNNFIFSTG